MELEVMLSEFNKTSSNEIFYSKAYKKFEEYVNNYESGEGMIGDNSYLMLWEKCDIEELNNDYEVNEFLSDGILIGSDGGDTAYGINKEGQFFEVPFIGMADEEIRMIGSNFIEFITTLYHQ